MNTNVQGKRRCVEITEQVAEIIVELHVFFNDYKKIAAWMNAKNLNLGGASPIHLINLNRGHKVLQFIQHTEEFLRD